MDEKYLFKAKSMEDGNWKIGYLVKNQEWAYIVKPLENGGFEFGTVDPNTICQCTGLKDKNGNLIWENDIIAYRDCTEEKYVIAWELDKACFEYQQYSCLIMNFDELSSCEVEVIGNIFDNTELLESEE